MISGARRRGRDTSAPVAGPATEGRHRRAEPMGSARDDPAGPSDGRGRAPVSGARVGSPARWWVALGFLAMLGGTVLALQVTADARDWWTWRPTWSRYGAAVAGAVSAGLLAWRVRGRPVLSGALAAVLLALLVAFPEPWALAGGAVLSGVTLSLLGVVMTRPATGPGLLLEVMVPLAFGVLGAVVVAGYDVTLLGSRFRVVVVALTLAGGLVLAWWLGQGFGSLGRRGIAVVAAGVVVLTLLVAYVQAVESWGSPGLLEAARESGAWVRSEVGAMPRSIEAFVGVPALVWGVWMRGRRRQGWWVCAFGGVTSAGLVTSLWPAGVPMSAWMLGTAYSLVIGIALGLVLIGVDVRVSSRAGGHVRSAGGPGRREPGRWSPLL